MIELLLILISAAVINNLALVYLIGLCPLLATTRRLEVAAILGVTAAVILPLTTVAAALIQTYWLQPAGLEHFSLIAFVFVTALLVLGLEAALQRWQPALASRIGPFLPLMLVNTSILGTALLSRQHDYGIPAAFAFGLGTGLGFALILILFAAQRERLQAADIPAAFRGAPIAFISLGLTAMAFLGLTGLIKI